MQVRFVGKDLVAPDGTIIPVSVELLKEACITEEYKTLRVRDIINDAVKSVIGYNVYYGGRSMYTKSQLYKTLEETVTKCEKYDEMKKRMAKIRNEVKELKDEGCKEARIFDGYCAPNIKKLRKITQREYYRRPNPFKGK